MIVACAAMQTLTYCWWRAVAGAGRGEAAATCRRCEVTERRKPQKTTSMTMAGGSIPRETDQTKTLKWELGAAVCVRNREASGGRPPKKNKGGKLVCLICLCACFEFRLVFSAKHEKSTVFEFC